MSVPVIELELNISFNALSQSDVSIGVSILGSVANELRFLAILESEEPLHDWRIYSYSSVSHKIKQFFQLLYYDLAWYSISIPMLFYFLHRIHRSALLPYGVAIA